MAEHQNAQKTASRLPNKDLWLAELDALEQEYLAFQQRARRSGYGLRGCVAGPRSHRRQMIWTSAPDPERRPGPSRLSALPG